MSSTAELLAEAEAVSAENPKKGEEIYKQILDASKSAVNPDELRDQETALVKLGELYREQKYVNPRVLVACTVSFSLILCLFRNAQGLAEVVTLSRSFLSSTAKAKTAKLSPAISSGPQV
jgi:26S proteasome regulatory subunit N6